MQVEFPDPQDVPVGTILPFRDLDHVPDNYRILNGDFLNDAEYEELYDALFNAAEQAQEMWKLMGGSVKMHGIVLPDLTDEQQYALVFGRMPYPDSKIVLAIKAQRASNS